MKREHDVIDLIGSASEDEEVTLMEPPIKKVTHVSAAFAKKASFISSTTTSSSGPEQVLPNSEETVRLTSKKAPRPSTPLVHGVKAEPLWEAAISIRSLLTECLEKECCAEASNYVLCSDDRLLHIGQRDRWSCGYRNLQMLLSALLDMPVSRSLFENIRLVPNILGIQTYIEKAWKAGFDPEGAMHFNHKLVDAKEWIGATEVVTLLRSFGLRCEVFDIEGTAAGEKLIRLVERYFKGGWPAIMQQSAIEAPLPSRSVSMVLPPLYLQYQGHSELVIGFQHHNGSDFLLVQNPARKTNSVVQALHEEKGWQRYCKKSLSSLKKRSAYQLVATNPTVRLQNLAQGKIIRGIKV